MTDLKALAARCVDMSEDAREVECQIAIAIWNMVPGPYDDPGRGARHLNHPNGRLVWGFKGDDVGPHDYDTPGEWGGFSGWDVFKVPPFLRSLDAAMSLARDDTEAVKALSKAIEWFADLCDTDARKHLPRYVTAAALLMRSQ